MKLRDRLVSVVLWLLALSIGAALVLWVSWIYAIAVPLVIAYTVWKARRQRGNLVR